jgi:hypothetical protein
MTSGELKNELAIVKAGRPRYFGFLKAGKTKLHALVVTARRIAGPVIAELQKDSGNPGAPVHGTVRYDDGAKTLLFQTVGEPPRWLSVAINEAALQQTLSLGAYTVSAHPEGQPLPTVEGGGEPLAPPPAAVAENAALAQACKARMGRIAGNVKRFLAAQPPDADRVQKLSGAMAQAVGRKDFQAVLSILDELEPLVEHVPGVTPSAASDAAPAPIATPAAPSRPAPADPMKDAAEGQILEQSRRTWEKARQTALADVERLKAAILSTYRAEEEYAAVAAGVTRLDAVFELLDEEFTVKLDQARTAAGAQRSQRRREALVVLERYKGYLTADPLLRALDDNPFVPLTFRKELLSTLRVLEQNLA